MKALKCTHLGKRSHERFDVKDRTLAILGFSIPFHIIEISKKGLAFRYVGTGKWFDDPLQLDISFERYSLKKIKVQTVSDLQIESDLIPMRRHSVKFIDLTISQVNQLVHLMGKCLV